MANTSATTHGGHPARTRRATYQDVLDAPAHRVAEVPRGRCACYARYDHDDNRFTRGPGRDHPVP